VQIFFSKTTSKTTKTSKTTLKRLTISGNWAFLILLQEPYIRSKEPYILSKRALHSIIWDQQSPAEGYASGVPLTLLQEPSILSKEPYILSKRALHSIKRDQQSPAEEHASGVLLTLLHQSYILSKRDLTSIFCSTSIQRALRPPAEKHASEVLLTLFAQVLYSIKNNPIFYPKETHFPSKEPYDRLQKNTRVGFY